MRNIFLIIVCSLVIACGTNQVHKNEFIALGTYLEVISSDPDTAGLVYQEAKRLEKIFNIYDPDSELSRLNNTHNTSVKVSRELLQALLKAQEVFDVTGGVFDVSCGNLFEHWKRAIRGGDNRSIPVNLELAACGMDSIVIDSHSSSVTIVKEGVKIDMAGIAKGFIVDQCIELLKTKGINNALINAGGDLYCLGENNYKQWRIGLRLPGPLTAIGRIYELNNQAMATSGDYEQFFELDGRRYSHIIDPKSAAPVQGKNMRN